MNVEMKELLIDELRDVPEYDNHHGVLRIHDSETGLHGFIAIHRSFFEKTSFGATRYATYKTERDALCDALRLSRLMSYKAAMAKFPYGGAKAVLIATPGITPEQKIEQLKKYAQIVERLEGKFTTGTDVGISSQELMEMVPYCKYLVGIHVDAAQYTAIGIYNGIRIALERSFGTRDISGRTIAIQGLGKIGMSLLEKVYHDAKTVYISDVDENACRYAKKQFPNVVVVEPSVVHELEVDVFSPCAMFGSISQKTVKKLKCKIVAGGANNQLETPQLGKRLHARNILYIPDYILNAGGLISVIKEFDNPNVSHHEIVTELSRIERAIGSVFRKSDRRKISTSCIADRMARNKIAQREIIDTVSRNSAYLGTALPLPEILSDALLSEAQGAPRHNVIAQLADDLQKKNAIHWERRGAYQRLLLFNEMTRSVPAYRDFLHRNYINLRTDFSVEDMRNIPVTDKQNYLMHYAAPTLSWKGIFSETQWVISSTSGSTGKAYYFPRSKYKDEEFALTAELCLVEYFHINHKRTLFIDCFALGIWIGGIFMYQAIKRIADKAEYPLSIITPGADKSETLKAIMQLSSHYDQIIIGGYGPLVKDLIDEGTARGIKWSDHSIKYFFAAEGFTEGFREYVVRYGGAKDIFVDTVNHYGTADLGTMAHETPLSIYIRRKALSNPKLFNELFSTAHRQPTLAQYIPELFYFEEKDGRLLCSGLGGFPLMRYDLKDRGGVIPFVEMERRFARNGIDMLKDAQTSGMHAPIWRLPFVYVYERNDQTVSIYSVNIYPESIRRALELNEFEGKLTGKFAMSAEFDEKQNQFLQIIVELHPNYTEESDFEETIVNSIVEQLNKENSEWRDFYNDTSIRKKIVPRLVFKPYQDEQYFKTGRKQQWVRKT